VEISVLMLCFFDGESRFIEYHFVDYRYSSWYIFARKSIAGVVESD